MKNISVFSIVGFDEKSFQISSEYSQQVKSHQVLKSYLARVLLSEDGAWSWKMKTLKYCDLLPNLLKLIKFKVIVQNEKLLKILDFFFHSGNSL